MRRARSFVTAAVIAASPPAGAQVLPATTDPARVGAWTLTIDGEEPAVNMQLLPDGNHVLYYSGFEFSHEDGDDGGDPFLEWQFWGAHPHRGSTRVLDLTRLGQPGAVSTPNNPEANGDIFCSAHVVRADDTLVAVGGTEYGPAADPANATFWDILRGIKRTHRFVNGGWEPGADMHYARWYPSAVNLPDGTTLVVSGIEVLADRATQQDMVERMRPDGTFEVVGRLDHKPLYPRLFVIPTAGPYEGKVLYTGLGQIWGPAGDFLDPEFTEQTVFDPATGAETKLGKTLLPSRDTPFCVLEPLTPPDYPTRVLCGGGAPMAGELAVALVERTELTAHGVVRKLGAPMHHARWAPLPVLLADGASLLVVGGTADHPNFEAGQLGPSRYPQMVPELYDFATGRWTEMAPMQVARQYHGTAILLPDGRVLVGGSTTHAPSSETVRENVEPLDQVVERRLTVYEPPYLHRGSRPVITNPQKLTLTYGGQASIRVASASPIASVHLIRPGPSTHSVDNEARVIKLDWKVTAAGPSGYELKLQAPPRPAVAPPGTYMLFVTRTTPAGPVPSVARMVRVEP